MALSVDDDLEYKIDDVELTSANVTIMPSGTSSYTISPGHSVVIVRRIGDSAKFWLASSESVGGGSLTYPVQPGDLVWDVNQTLYCLKYSTGGNSFVNFNSMVGMIDSGEMDGVNILVWNGLLTLP